MCEVLWYEKIAEQGRISEVRALCDRVIDMI